MNKLQLYMTMSKNGNFATKLDINAEQYVRSWVCDLHDTVCQVDYPTAERSIFYLIKYIDTGFFVVVIRTIPGPSHGNHLASWIYVPYSLRITDAQIADTVRFITDKVSTSDIKGSDVAAMRERFDQQYDEDPIAPVFAQSSGLSVAYRYYGTQYALTIADLVGRYRFQTAYIPYAAVLLVDVRITSDIAGQDLSASPLDNMGVLMPPASNTTERQPYIYNQPFDMPFFVPMMRPVSVTWRMDGAEDVIDNITVQRHLTNCPTPIFEAPAAEPEAVEDAPESAEPEPTSAPEDEPEPEIPAVEDDEPDQIDETPAKATTNEPTTASDLPRRSNTYYFQMPAKRASIGSVIEFELTTNTALHESPVEGYEATGTIREGAAYRNHLVYAGANSRSALIQKAIWGAAGLLVGICLTLLCTLGHGNSGKAEATEQETVEQVAANEATDAQKTDNAAQQTDGQTKPEAPAEKQTDTTLAAAIMYLDTHKVWKKAELEQYPDLIGLYDDLNNYNHKRIIETWGVKLKDSREFKNVANHANMAAKAHKRPKPVGGGATYNKPNDTSITVRTYLNTIDP